MIPPLARSTWPLIQAASGPARNATALAMSSGVDVNLIKEFLAARDLSVSHVEQEVVVALVGPTKISAKTRQPKAR
jgi:hypothetical protein